MSDARLEWTFNPWRERRGAAIAAAAGVAVILGLMVVQRLQPLPLVLFIVAVHSLLGPAYWPQRCRLDSQGVSGPRTGRRPWSAFRRAVVRRDGLLLSPHAAPSRLDIFQALFFPFPAAERERLQAQVRPLIAEHGL